MLYLKTRKDLELGTIYRIVIGLAIIGSVMTLIGTNSAFADDTSKDNARWRGSPNIGFSPYTGIIGAEIQRSHFGLTIGLPTCLGLRYYPDKKGYRWFFGAHAMYYDLEKDQTKNGIRYDSQKSTILGLGFGYKWRWRNHWELTASLSIVYNKEEIENDAASRTDEYILPMPGIAFGYSF